MTCPHISSATREYNACALGLYGGKPSHGTCKVCIEKGQNTEAYATAERARLSATQKSGINPKFREQVKSALLAVKKFAASGFGRTPPEILTERKAICNSCEYWDRAALNSSGKCRKCGCSTWAKLRMAAEKCPVGKWGSVNETLTNNPNEPDKN